jgi:hypothetical protein
MENSIYDNYAAAALQALVSKSPLLDKKGEIGEKKSEEEMQEIKKELCRTAHAYAAWMMQTRQEYVDYLKSIDIMV